MRKYALLSLICLMGLVMSCEPDEGETPQADINVSFESSFSKIFEGDTVWFTDLSSGNPDTWYWEFPGGTPETSTEQNPMVIYEGAGSYSVFLRASKGEFEDQRRKFEQVQVRKLDSPPYDGTVWINPGMITEDDPSSYQSMEDIGQELRTMFDRRTNSWEEVNAHVFRATFEDGQTIDMQVNPEFDQATAREYALLYAPMVGQLPKMLIVDVKTVSIQGGNELWGGGSNDILIHTEQGESYIAGGWTEEVMIHEAGHVSLQHLHDDDTYNAFRRMDPTNLSTYARDNPQREDVAESIGPYMTYRYHPERLTEEEKYIFSRVMPNRIKYFDAQNYDVYPWGQ